MSDGSYKVRVVKAFIQPSSKTREDITRKKSGVKTLGAARFLRSEFEVQVQEEFDLRVRGISTIEQAIEQFFVARGNQFSPASLIGMKQNFDQYLAPIMKSHVTKVTRSQIEDMLQLNLGRVTPATLDRVATNLRALFRFLMERGSIKENPAQYLKFG
jgi:hypothetical protein